jgi:hypothetical protein
MHKIWTNFSKFFQEVGDNLCYKHIFGEKKRTILWSYVQLKKLKKSNIVPPSTLKFQFEVVIQKIQKNLSNQLGQNILNLGGAPNFSYNGTWLLHPHSRIGQILGFSNYHCISLPTEK